MANAFSQTKTWRFAGPNNQELIVKRGNLVIDTTANGGAAEGDLPASMFGLRRILYCSTIVNDGKDKLYFAGPDHEGDSLVVGGGASNAFADLPNDTYSLTIIGY